MASYSTGGSGWTPWPGPPDQGRDFATDGTSIYAATQMGIYKFDGAWAATANTDDVEKVFYDGTYLYSLNAAKVSISADNGNSWIFDRLPSGSNDDYFGYRCVGRLGSTTYIGKGNEILSSTDGFATYQTVPNSRGPWPFSRSMEPCSLRPETAGWRRAWDGF